MNTDAYKTLLEEEKKKLSAELAGVGKKDPTSDNWNARPLTADPSEIDPNTQADRFEDYEEKTALMVPLEARLAEVNTALEKIQNGTYGKCEVCGEDIEEARLGANSAATTCLKHINEQ